MAALDAAARLKRDPRVVLVNWNCEPRVFMFPGRLEHLRGELTAAGCAARDKGNGRKGDHGIASLGYINAVSVDRVLDAPRSTHCGSQVTLEAR